MVPSMSEMSTMSVESQTKIRAVHAITPDVERENVIVFAPAFKLSAFCGSLIQLVDVNWKI